MFDELLTSLCWFQGRLASHKTEEEISYGHAAVLQSICISEDARSRERPALALFDQRFP